MNYKKYEPNRLTQSCYNLCENCNEFDVCNRLCYARRLEMRLYAIENDIINGKLVENDELSENYDKLF